MGTTEKRVLNSNGIGNRLKDLRTTAGISQRKLAAQMGRASSAISKYERGGRIPTLDVLTDYANIFNVSYDYLLLGSQTKEDSIKKFRSELIKKQMEHYSDDLTNILSRIEG